MIRPDRNIPIPEDLEKLASQVVDAAFTVHKRLGPGLLESVYETCFCHELEKRGLRYQRQMSIPIIYDDMVLDNGLRLDVLVEDAIICELKAAEGKSELWIAQILSYLKLLNKRVGFLVNFNKPTFKRGVKRLVL